MERFLRRWLEASGEFFSITSDDNLGDQLVRFIQENEIASVVIADSPSVRGIAKHLESKVEIAADFGCKENRYDRRTAIELCSRAEAGITGVDALIADTGTLVIASRRIGDRLCSSLPPIHMAIATEAPIYDDIGEFLRSADQTLTMSFITGPSRTADIEKILILGAHGPVRVIVWGSE